MRRTTRASHGGHEPGVGARTRLSTPPVKPLQPPDIRSLFSLANTASPSLSPFAFASVAARDPSSARASRCRGLGPREKKNGGRAGTPTLPRTPARFNKKERSRSQNPAPAGNGNHGSRGRPDTTGRPGTVPRSRPADTEKGRGAAAPPTTHSRGLTRSLALCWVAGSVLGGGTRPATAADRRPGKILPATRGSPA